MRGIFLRRTPMPLVRPVALINPHYNTFYASLSLIHAYRKTLAVNHPLKLWRSRVLARYVLTLPSTPQGFVSRLLPHKMSIMDKSVDVRDI